LQLKGKGLINSNGAVARNRLKKKNSRFPDKMEKYLLKKHRQKDGLAMVGETEFEQHEQKQKGEHIS
jgi:hypothetical protein